MTTQDALLAAVLANPADDVVRKAYADHCRENGQEERADFVEVQCRIAEMGECECGQGPKVHECRKCYLQRRERELMDDGGGRFECWASDFDSLRPLLLTGGSVSYQRGFVSEIRTTLADWCGGECECVSRWDLHRVPPGETIAGGHGCYACGGTGTRKSIGPEVVRRHPVQAVRFTDVVAVPRRGTGKYEIAIPYTYTLHFDMALVAGGAFNTEQEALDALSAAALAFAESQNRLTRTHPHLAIT